MVNGGICSCAELVNGGLAHVKLYYGQCWICSCAVEVNSGYAHVWDWSIVDMLMCSGGQ